MGNSVKGQQYNEETKHVVTEEVSVTIKELSKETIEESPEEAEKRYRELMEIYNMEKAKVIAFGEEMKELFHKSQDTFEKQLSFISAGSLALSVGFIKDIVQPIKDSSYKWMLLVGWGLLISTLILNLVSHMLAARYARKGAKETEDIENSYDSQKIDRRARCMDTINWTTVGMLVGGMIAIVVYITLNAIL